MQKDLKIGMLFGLVIVVAATTWLATQQRFSIRSRLLQRQSSGEFGYEPTEEVLPAGGIATADSERGTSEVETFPSGVVDTTIYEQVEKIKTQKFHIVSKGETLSAIAKKYYGSAAKMKKIYNVNRKTITNIDMLKPGTKLIIPD